MVSLIIGHKGSGKTKLLVDKVNAAIEKSDGHVICVEKETKLTYDVNYRARLVATDSYFVSGFDAFYGFLSGLCAGDHDITDIFVDATFASSLSISMTGFSPITISLRGNYQRSVLATRLRIINRAAC